MKIVGVPVYMYVYISLHNAIVKLVLILIKAIVKSNDNHSNNSY